MKPPDASITKIGEKICDLYPDSPNAEDIIERAKAMLEKKCQIKFAVLGMVDYDAILY